LLIQHSNYSAILSLYYTPTACFFSDFANWVEASKIEDFLFQWIDQRHIIFESKKPKATLEFP